MRRRAFLALSLLAAGAFTAAYAARTMLPAEVSVVDWEAELTGFGGWSAIDLAADGISFIAVSDFASITRGRLLRENGRLVGVRAVPPIRLRDDEGPLDVAFSPDAEGVSLLEDGTFAISFERYHRVWLYGTTTDQARALPPDADFGAFAFNGGLEALATAPDGAILAIPEQPQGDAAAFRVYRFRDGRWSQPYRLHRDGPWSAVGADLGDDGALYLLERRFLGIGFMSRIRRFDIGDGVGAASELLPGEVLYRSPPGRHGNLEGIAISRDGRGRQRAVLVSDDNFLPVLRSQVVEIVLPM